MKHDTLHPTTSLSVSNLFYFIFIVVFLLQCNSRPYVVKKELAWEKTILPSGQVSQRIFLIGDTGAPQLDKPDLVFELLKQRASANSDSKRIILLGDNIYPRGLPPELHPRRDFAQKRLERQLDYLAAMNAKITFIPGNHDWNDGKKFGNEYVLNQEKYVEERLGYNAFRPSSGLPGPEIVELPDNLRIIFIDTQWWLHPHQREIGDNGEFYADEEGDVIVELEKLLLKNDDETVLVMGHHPLISDGHHGGYFSFKENVFPLTQLKSWAYLPLPLIGSLPVLYMRFIGGRQDLAHHRYSTMINYLKQTFSKHERLIYASGHEHNLQYLENTELFGFKNHFIVSGSGSKITHVARGKNGSFSAKRKGFVEIIYYKTGETWMQVWSPANDGGGEILFRKQLLESDSEFVNKGIEQPKSELHFSDSTKTKAINTNYSANLFVKALLGPGNRALWTTPVEFNYLDVGTQFGGLSPVKRGGGMQTINIRMADSTGNEYALRSIDKDASLSVPELYAQTAAVDVLQDQISALHPYGSIVVPKLAEAADIFRTYPEIFYVPDDPRMGIYRDVVAGQIMMLEERPKGDESNNPNFGSSEDVEHYNKVYQNITKDNDDEIDQRLYARNVLFSMWIGDWDRGRQQYKWAEYKKPGGGNLYKPIPGDRDFAFFSFDGPVPDFVRLFDSRFQHFGENYGNVKGLTRNGLEQDRRFMNELRRSDWKEIVDSLKQSLTDSVIEEAVGQLPPPIYDKNGAEMIRLLKIRRDKLPETADELYVWNSKVVDVVGSNDRERFEVVRYTADSTQVRMYKIDEKSNTVEKMLFQRTFTHDVTKELRLYGLGGDDEFYVSGKVASSPRVRIIGGTGRDMMIDYSHVKGLSKKTIFYDTESTYAEAGKETSTHLTNDPAINDYNSRDYQHNANLLLTFFGSNPDDGFFIGGGMRFIRHGFRAFPYKRIHRVKGNIAAKTLGYNLAYEGHLKDAFGPFDAFVDVNWLSPTNVLNFYGFGNDTDFVNDADQFQANLNQLNLGVSAYKLSSTGSFFKIGPSLEFIRVSDLPERFGGRFESNTTGLSDVDDLQSFAGIDLTSMFHNLLNPVNPKQGFRWFNAADFNNSLKNDRTRYLRLSTDLSIYFSPIINPQLTFALRLGAAHNFGDFPFYHANTLGGTTNLRGFRGNRFTGRSSAYMNNEVRLRLSDFSTYLLVGEMGILAFHDIGRVWDVDRDDSITWHSGYGGGLWFNIFDMAVITPTVGSSVDGTYFYLKFGFQY